MDVVANAKKKTQTAHNNNQNLNDMKMINLLLTMSVFMIGLGCSKDEPEPSKDKIIGTWIETNPDLFDGISDTIVFTEDASIKKHFYFDGWSYTTSSDTISFQKDEKVKKFLYSTAKENEMVIYNFIDRSITSQVKDIQFTKIK